jgi:hypothetical protein
MIQCKDSDHDISTRHSCWYAQAKEITKAVVFMSRQHNVSNAATVRNGMTVMFPVGRQIIQEN